jgi:hypothetical protein
MLKYEDNDNPFRCSPSPVIIDLSHRAAETPARAIAKRRAIP